MNTEPKERPIIFSAPMVRAILDGRKTQTRRIVKPQPENTNSGWTTLEYMGEGIAIECGPNYPDDASDKRFCPYGQPGDRLWVRETWRIEGAGNGVPTDACRGKRNLEYCADGYEPISWQKRSPIHMPRWASRILLEITDVRVERLQEISEADAVAEGAMYHDGGDVGHSGWRHDHKDVHSDARSSFARLWESIHGPGSWDANPWVWVVEFQRVT